MNSMCSGRTDASRYADGGQGTQRWNRAWGALHRRILEHDEGADALAQAIVGQADGGMGANARAAHPGSRPLRWRRC